MLRAFQPWSRIWNRVGTDGDMGKYLSLLEISYWALLVGGILVEYHQTIMICLRWRRQGRVLSRGVLEPEG